MKLGLGALGAMIGGRVLAGPDRCGLTPQQTKGPFYPVRDQICRPVPGASIEIWQACVS